MITTRCASSTRPANSAFPTNDKGVPRTLQLLVNSDDSARLRCARNIAATLTELGLACETVESPTSVYEARLQAANYDIYLGITKLPTTADLSESLPAVGAK